MRRGSDSVLQHVVRHPRGLRWFASRRCCLVGGSGVPTRNTYSGMFANLDRFTRRPRDDSGPRGALATFLFPSERQKSR